MTKHYVSHMRGVTFREIVGSLFHRRKVIVPAVTDVSFEVPEGQVMGLLGPNGAGKSTLIKMLTGVMLPTAGEARVLGYTPWRQHNKYVFHIGAVLGQKSQLIWDIPPADAFYMNKAIYDIAKDRFRKNLSELTELLDVGDVVKKPTRQLSLGERMKCEFIMAMLHDPRIVFLDEPTIGIDILAKEKIRGFIREKNKNGVTFIQTTHDLEDVERLARRIIVINAGRIVFDNSMAALRNHLGQNKRVKIVSTEPLPPVNFIRKNGPRKVTLHSLRHTNAPMMIAEGVDVCTVSKRLGHANTATTLNIYAHALKSRDSEAADKLEHVFSNTY